MQNLSVMISPKSGLIILQSDWLKHCSNKSCDLKSAKCIVIDMETIIIYVSAQ